MNKIFTWLRRLLAGRTVVAADPLAAMTLRELADLPAHHPCS